MYVEIVYEYTHMIYLDQVCMYMLLYVCVCMLVDGNVFLPCTIDAVWHEAVT